MLVSAREKSQQLIVWLWHGSGLAVARGFCADPFGMPMCLWCVKGHQKSKRCSSPPVKNIRSSLTQQCTESLFTSAATFIFLFFIFSFFPPTPPAPQTPYFNEQTIQTRWGGSGLRAHSCISQESASTRHHAEDTICRC